MGEHTFTLEELQGMDLAELKWTAERYFDIDWHDLKGLGPMRKVLTEEILFVQSQEEV